MLYISFILVSVLKVDLYQFYSPDILFEKDYYCLLNLDSSLEVFFSFWISQVFSTLLHTFTYT